jgi:hypothetical protein
MAQSHSKRHNGTGRSQASVKRHKEKFLKGDLVLVKTPVDEYSIISEAPALVIKDVESYDAFARVMYKGSTRYVHVHRLKRITNENS